MTRKPLLLCLLTLILASSLLAAPTDPVRFSPVQNGPTADAEEILPYAPDRVLIKFTNQAMTKGHLSADMERRETLADTQTGLASVDALLDGAGVSSIERAFVRPARASKAADLGVERWYLARVAEGRILDLVAALQKDPDVETAGPDWRAFPAAIPNDTYYADNWGHDNTAQLPDLDWGGTYDHTLSTTVGTVGFDANAPAAWDGSQGYGDSGVIVAIVDSGVDVDHDDLRLVAGYDYGDNDANPDDDSAVSGHGTCCAGVAAAIAGNGNEVVGVAGGCSVMPLKVANSAGSMYLSSIANAIYHAADNGADVISMSLGAPLSSDPATDAAIAYAYDAGCTILAATGNENDSTIGYPAINANVIGVGAASPCGDRKRSSSSSTECNPDVYTDPNGYTCDGERWWGSNYGTTVRDAAGAVDILGPTILPTTDIEGSGGYRSGDVEPFFNGTSCATPYVAGVAALVVSANPAYSPAQVRDALTSTAQDVVNVESGSGWDRYSGYGMVDAAAAVGGGGPVAPTADFTGDPLSGQYPLDVAFTDLSTGAPTSWSWSFGDGGTSNAQNPSHTYTSAGTYTVSLTAANDEGSDTATRTGYITVTEPGVTTYVTASGETAVTGNVSGTYAATAQSDDVRQTITEVAYTGHPRKTYSFLEHRWTFDLPSGGEATFHLEASRTANTDGDDFLFQYSTDGATWLSLTTVASAVESAASVSLGTLSGTVYVRVTDTDRNWGNSSNDAVSIDWMAFEMGDVQPVAPTADFAGTPTSGDSPLIVQFTDASSGDPTSWSWTFGDGGTSTAQNPSHTYTAAGTYTVSLTATNAQGGDTATKTGFVTVTEPGQGGTTMHVDAMSVTRRKVGPNYVGTCVVTIVDDTGAAVSGATVTATYSGPTSGTADGVTASDGTVTLQSNGQKKPSGEWCFEVTDVTHADLSYVSGDNTVTEVCESGTVYGANEVVSTEVTLMPNSPNPFNPMTELSFSLPRAMHATLTVYNARGEVAAVLVDGQRGAGVHRVSWNAQGHPSGVYFSRLVTGNTVQTGKLILLK